MLARLASLCSILACVSGCPGPVAEDVGVDGGLDAPPPPDVPIDGGPVCATECATSEACCLVAESPMCIDVFSDPLNCGECEVDCAAERRGDGCMRGRCSCGDFDIGCTGTVDVCCPARADLAAHCANLSRAELDCGECGNECDVARSSACLGGRCLCGTTGRECSGAAEDTCCPLGISGATYGCVDTTADHDHCGACDRRCGFDQRCLAGRCVSLFDVPPTDAGEPDAPPDDAPELDAGVDAGLDDVGVDAP